MLFERSFETGRVFVIKGSRRVLVKLVLFQTMSTKTLSFSWQKLAQFQNFFQTMGNRAFFWVIQFFPTSNGIEMTSCQSLKSEKSVRLILIYVVKCSFFVQFFGLQTSKTRHFYASWGRKQLYTSKESPITHCLKEVLKLEEFLPWKAPDEF